MSVTNKPPFSDNIQWAYDYVVMSWNGTNFVETYTYKANGTHNHTTGAYTGGTTVGYMYILYDDASKTNFVSSYAQKA